MSRELFKAIAPLARRIRLMAARAILTLIDDATKMQGLQVKLLDGEVCNNVDRVQNYGFTSVPLPGAEGIYLALGGSRDHGVVIVSDDRRYRIKGLQGGEVAIYTWKDKEPHGHRIVFNNDGSISVNAKNINVTATEKVRIEGDVVKIHAKTLFDFDTNGHGQKWYSTHIDTWQIGETAGTAHAISPPETP